MTRCLLYSLALLSLAIGCDAPVTSDTYDATSEYEAAVASFGIGTPDEETSEAIQLIGSAGVDAFDTLLAHLDDETRASNKFMRQMMNYEPTIGDACFDMLHGQLEGAWPRRYREHQVLNRSNIRDWLAKRNDKTLHELRLECARRSLDSAKQAREQDPSEFTQSYVGYLAKKLSAIEAED